MGRIYTVTNSDSTELGVRKSNINREIVIGPNAIKFIAIIIFAVLALVYLTQSTAGANRGLKVRDLASKKASLRLEEERLQAEQTRLRSLKEIDSGIEKPSMEPAAQMALSNPTQNQTPNQ